MIGGVSEWEDSEGSQHYYSTLSPKIRMSFIHQVCVHVQQLLSVYLHTVPRGLFRKQTKRHTARYLNINIQLLRSR